MGSHSCVCILCSWMFDAWHSGTLTHDISHQVCGMEPGVFHVHHICICFIHNVYHMYIVCQSQTTKFMGARFDRLIPPLCSKASQMDRGHKPLFLSVDIHSAFPSGYMQVPFWNCEKNTSLNSRLIVFVVLDPWDWMMVETHAGAECVSPNEEFPRLHTT